MELCTSAKNLPTSLPRFNNEPADCVRFYFLEKKNKNNFNKDVFKNICYQNTMIDKYYMYVNNGFVLVIYCTNYL